MGNVVGVDRAREVEGAESALVLRGHPLSVGRLGAGRGALLFGQVLHQRLSQAADRAVAGSLYPQGVLLGVLDPAQDQVHLGGQDATVQQGRAQDFTVLQFLVPPGQIAQGRLADAQHLYGVVQQAHCPAFRHPVPVDDRAQPAANGQVQDSPPHGQPAHLGIQLYRGLIAH